MHLKLGQRFRQPHRSARTTLAHLHWVRETRRSSRDDRERQQQGCCHPQSAVSLCSWCGYDAGPQFCQYSARVHLVGQSLAHVVAFPNVQCRRLSTCFPPFSGPVRAILGLKYALLRAARVPQTCSGRERAPPRCIHGGRIASSNHFATARIIACTRLYSWACSVPCAPLHP